MENAAAAACVARCLCKSIMVSRLIWASIRSLTMKLKAIALIHLKKKHTYINMVGGAFFLRVRIRIHDPL